jgi:hypothetical protein
MQQNHRKMWLFSALLVVGSLTSYCMSLAIGRFSADRSGEYEHVWTWQERAQWVAWKLGFRKDPPYDPLIDLITNTIETRSGWSEEDTQLSLQIASHQSVVDEGQTNSE